MQWLIYFYSDFRIQIKSEGNYCGVPQKVQIVYNTRTTLQGMKANNISHQLHGSLHSNYRQKLFMGFMCENCHWWPPSWLLTEMQSRHCNSVRIL